MLPGLSRSADKCYKSLADNLLSKYDVDVYIHTYEQTEISLNDSSLSTTTLSARELVDLLRPKKIVVENYDLVKNEFIRKYEKFYNIKCSAERCTSHLYKIKKCFEMIDEKYDVYIRSRMDVMYETPISISSLDMSGINIPLPTQKKTRLEDGYYFSYCTDFYHHSQLIGVLDHIAIGDFQNMKNYCSIYDNLEEMCIHKKIRYDTGEVMVLENLKLTNTKLNRFFCEYSLHRRHF